MFTALVVYEYFITLDQEVATVWKRKFNATSCLLVTTRWVMLLNQIFTWTPGAQNVSSWGSLFAVAQA